MRYLILLLFFLMHTAYALAQSVSKKQAVADIDYFNAALAEVHFNPWQHISQNNYLHKADSLKQTLKDSVSTRQLVLMLGELSAAIGDSHTSPAVIQQVFRPDFRKPIYFPLTMIADDQLDVYMPAQTILYQIPVGAKLLSVNGIVLKELYKQTIQRLGGLPTFRNEMAVKMLGYNLYLAGARPPFKLNYVLKNKPGVAKIDSGVILKDCLSKALPQLVTPYTFQVLEHKAGYLNLTSMSGDYRNYAKFFDSCFSVVRLQNIHTMIVDLRSNTGGNSIIADLLISYFNTKPYALSGGKYWRVSKRYKQLLVSRGDTANNYLKQPDNTIWNLLQCGPKAPVFIDNSNLFTGKVYLLTAPLTFSSANMLADGVKQYKMATIAGQPTGENTSDYGETYPLELPNSKITMQISTTFDVGVDCNAKSMKPVVPDMLITPSLKDKINGADPVLKQLLNNIR